MADLLYRSGSTPPAITGPTYEDGPNGQRMTAYVARGTEAECTAQRSTWRALGAAYLSLGPDGSGQWECRASFPWGIDGQNEAPTDVHELETIVATPSIWSSTRLAGLISDTNLATTKNVVKEFAAGTITKLSQANAFLTANISDATERARAQALFVDVAIRGMETFEEYRQVYRRTLTVSSPSQLKASQVGVGQIWTTSEVMAYEGLTNAWYFVLPELGLWLKAKPNVTSAARGKTQISYYYTLADFWSSLAYPAHGAATENTTTYHWEA